MKINQNPALSQFTTKPAVDVPAGENLSDMFRTVKSIARSVARNMPAGDSHVDDLYSAGLLALVEATRRFDRNRGVAFRSFAQHRIHGAMLDELRRLDTVSRERRRAIRQGEHQKRSIPRLVELSAAESVVDEVVDLDEQINRKQWIARLRAAEPRLPRRLRLVLRLRIEADWSLREIADHLGVTQGRACQLVGKGVQMLRDEVLGGADNMELAAAA